MARIVGAFGFTDAQQLWRLMRHVQLVRNRVADLSVCEEIQEICIHVRGQVPLPLSKLQGHAAHAAARAVFEHNNGSAMRRFQRVFPIL